MHKHVKFHFNHVIIECFNQIYSFQLKVWGNAQALYLWNHYIQVDDFKMGLYFQNYVTTCQLVLEKILHPKEYIHIFYLFFEFGHCLHFFLFSPIV